MQQLKFFEQSDITNLQHFTTQNQIQAFLKNRGIQFTTVISFITQLYQFATIAHYNSQQKLKILNLAINILKEVSKSKTKEEFAGSLKNNIQLLSKRDEYFKQSFSNLQLADLTQYFKEKMLPYYELYQMVLDQHPHFRLQAFSADLVKVKVENGLQGGATVDVENVAILKQFLGVRAAKQEKKDGKKK